MKKLGTQNWDTRVNFSITPIIIVDTWCVVKIILGNWYKDTEDTLYTNFAKEMVENSIDPPQRKTSRTYKSSVATGLPSTLDIMDYQASSRIGVHLTPTKKRRPMKAQLTNYMRHNLCSDCTGKKTFKPTYVC